jgi:SAM-dependent methyltransferase
MAGRGTVSCRWRRPLLPGRPTNCRFVAKGASTPARARPGIVNTRPNSILRRGHEPCRWSARAGRGRAGAESPAAPAPARAPRRECVAADDGGVPGCRLEHRASVVDVTQETEVVFSQVADEPIRAHPRAGLGRHVGDTLRAGGHVTDSRFDDLFPIPIRAMSRIYWTPVRVARRAAELLVGNSTRRVLDVGSGAGKFCVIGALSTRGRFFGVEQNPALVDCARDVAGLLGLADTTFTCGAFHAQSPTSFDAFYFFNPFEENRLPGPAPTGPEPACRFDSDVRRAQDFLRAADRGARVVTYNGLGGPIPEGYRLARRDPIGCGLELWVKV